MNRYIYVIQKTSIKAYKAYWVNVILEIYGYMLEWKSHVRFVG